MAGGRKREVRKQQQCKRGDGCIWIVLLLTSLLPSERQSCQLSRQHTEMDASSTDGILCLCGQACTQAKQAGSGMYITLAVQPMQTYSDCDLLKLPALLSCGILQYAE